MAFAPSVDEIFIFLSIFALSNMSDGTASLKTQNIHLFPLVSKSQVFFFLIELVPSTPDYPQTTARIHLTFTLFHLNFDPTYANDSYASFHRIWRLGCTQECFVRVGDVIY